jgi:proteasome lid subunit RPN8/RPN11
MTKKKTLPKVEIVGEATHLPVEIETVLEVVEAAVIEAPGLLDIYTKFNGDFYDLPQPDNGPYFVPTAQGWYYYKHFAFGRAIMPTKEHPTVLGTVDPKHKGGLFWHNYEDAPIIPLAIMNQIVSFFRGVYSRIQTEAEVMLLFNTTTKEYKVFVPVQICGGASVDYTFDATKIPSGYSLVGSVHSHPVFSAFHSGTDTHDAKTFDGLHITVGHVTDYKQMEFASMISLGGSNFNYKIEEVADVVGLEDVGIPEWWYSLVKKPTAQTVGQFVKSTTNQNWGLDKSRANKWYKGWQGGNEDSWPDSYDGYTAGSGSAYSSQLGISVPKKWLESVRTGKIKPEYWPEAIELLAKKLNKECEKAGYVISFMVGEVIDPSADSEKDKVLTTSTLSTMLNQPVDEVEDYIGE